MTSKATDTPSPGLIIFDVGIQAEQPAPAMLRAFLGGAREAAFQKPVELVPEGRQLWFALHSHLLANGPADIRVVLATAAGQVLGSQALTIQVRNEGPLAESVRRSLRESGAPLFVDVCDSGTYAYADESLMAWFDRAPQAVEAHLSALSASGAATDEEVALLRRFAAEGYLEMADVIDEEHLQRLNAALDDAVAKKVEGYEWGASQRIHNLHLTYPAIRELWMHPRILRMLRLIFEARPHACQTLTYVFGSEQQYHQDTVALTPFPAGRMCGVWTALEDIQPESGELIVWPGSHRLPRVYMKPVGLAKVTDDWSAFGEVMSPLWGDMLKDFEKRPYRPKKGAVLIWHENLMHGGMIRVDRQRSRRSIVSHYFADGCIAYHDASGMPGRLEPTP